MAAICRDGPAEGQHLEIPSPPPKAVRVEVFPEDDDGAGSVVEGTEFPTIIAQAYGYRLAAELVSQISKDPRAARRTAEYVYDPALDPEIAEYVR